MNERSAASPQPGRRVTTRAPSFPEVVANSLLQGLPDTTWQVLCGDRDHWRVGLFSPAHDGPERIVELERHDCPELFVLLSGRITLVLGDGEGGVRELELVAGQPVLVDAPHDGYCPEGPHSGVALVVERDAFGTECREIGAWR